MIQNSKIALIISEAFCVTLNIKNPNGVLIIFSRHCRKCTGKSLLGVVLASRLERAWRPAKA